MQPRKSPLLCYLLQCVHSWQRGSSKHRLGNEFVIINAVSLSVKCVGMVTGFCCAVGYTLDTQLEGGIHAPYMQVQIWSSGCSIHAKSNLLHRVWLTYQSWWQLPHTGDGKNNNVLMVARPPAIKKRIQQYTLDAPEMFSSVILCHQEGLILSRKQAFSRL